MGPREKTTKSTDPYERMPRSDEAAAFFHAVYSAVQEIPHGKVTSYGHIAKLVGTRESLSRSTSCFYKPSAV